MPHKRARPSSAPVTIRWPERSKAIDLTTLRCSALATSSQSSTNQTRTVPSSGERCKECAVGAEQEPGRTRVGQRTHLLPASPGPRPELPARSPAVATTRPSGLNCASSDLRVVAAQHMLRPTAGGVPHAGESAIVRREDPAAIRAEVHRPDRALVPAQNRAQRGGDRSSECVLGLVGLRLPRTVQRQAQGLERLGRQAGHRRGRELTGLRTLLLLAGLAVLPEAHEGGGADDHERGDENSSAHYALRSSTRDTKWSGPFSRITSARGRVGWMFSRRFGRFVRSQIPVATSIASSSDSAA